MAQRLRNPERNGHRYALEPAGGDEPIGDLRQGRREQGRILGDVDRFDADAGLPARQRPHDRVFDACMGRHVVGLEQETPEPGPEIGQRDAFGRIDKFLAAALK